MPPEDRRPAPRAAGAGRPDQLAGRPLTEPALCRLPMGTPRRDEILAAHAAALAAGEAGYTDPGSGLFVLTARFLADRGSCCGRGCRHCPYVVDQPA
jgi:hypothetical protein